MTLIHDDESEEVGREVREQLLAVELLVEVLVVGEEDLSDQVISSRDDILVQDDALMGAEGREGPVGLILEAVSVGQEEHAIAGENAAGQELPDELEHGEGFAGAGGHQQQHPLVVLREAVERLEDRHLLVGAYSFESDPVLVVGRLEDGPPLAPDDVPAEPAQDVAGRGGSVGPFVLPGLVVGQDVIVTIARDGEAKPQAPRVP